MPALNFSSLNRLKIPTLNVEEQEKIANFFTSIDQKLELVSWQLNKTQEFKKGLLQQMFV